MSFVVSDCEKKYFLRWFLLVAAMSSCPFIGYTEEPINPSNSFYLPAAEVPKMESAALHAGNREAAVRLASYYGICRNKPLLGNIWSFRAAQLGDILAAYNLCVGGLFDKKAQLFSSVLSNKTDLVLLSNVAKEYVYFHGLSNRLDNVHSPTRAHNTIRLLDAELPVVRIGSVDAAFDRGGKDYSWPIRYMAYEVRCRSHVPLKKEALEILVFPAFHGMYQSAVDIAEANSMPLIVVATDFEDPFGIRPKEVSQKECCRCVCRIVKRVISDYSLPSDTVIRFAEDPIFAEQMKTEGRVFTIKPAASCFVRRK